MVNGAGRCNFVIERGSKWAPLISSWVDETGATVAPNGYSDAELIAYDTDGTALFTLSSGSGITLGATTIQFLLSSTATGALATGTYPYLMTLTGADTQPFAFLRGVVTVEDTP